LLLGRLFSASAVLYQSVNYGDGLSGVKDGECYHVHKVNM